ncbi:MAG: SBBP repeat-containing protein [Lewinellaceae bacterium]|nr:SBBP repeat-containing protein [Lewinellaceae bacterium]
MKPQVLVSRFPSFFRTLFFGGLPALALLLAAGTASGQILDWVNQPFSQAFIGGTDQGYAVAYDASGNVYVTGSFAGTADFDPGPGTANLTSAGGDDIFVAKYDASGNYIWANRIGGTGGDIGYGLAVDGSGNVHVTGYFSGSNVDFDPGPGTENLSSAGGIDIFFAKYDASGNYVWANRVGGTSGEQGRGIAVDGIGNVHLTGSFRGNNVDFDPGPGIVNLSSNSFTTDIFIAKYDASGNYVWANRVGSSNGLSDVGYGLALDVSGNVHVTGHFTGTADFDPGAGTANLTSAGNIDIFIAKYDASGNYVWANRVGGSGSDTGNSLAVDGSGNVHLTGFFQATVDFDPGAGPANLTSIGNVDIFIAKYNASGNYVWAKQVGNTGVNYGNGLALDGSGNVHVTGQFQGTNVDFDPGGGTANLSSAGSDDIFIAKYNASGNYVWAKRIGGTINDQGLGLAVDGSGNVHVTGSFRGTDVDFDPGAGTAELSAGAGNSDAFALRLSAAGNYDWAVNWGQYNNTAPTPTLMECRAIARDASGNVYATGSFQGLYVDFDPGAGTAYLTSAGGSDIFIAKYDASGNYVWAKRIGGTSTDIGYGLAVDAGGNVHVTGQFSGSNIDFDPGAGTALLSSSAVDLFVAKYDASGNYVWAKRIGGTSTDIGYGLAVDGSGNIYVTGIFLGSNVDFDPGIGTAPLSSAGGADIFIAKYDASGGYLWANRVGSTGADNGYGLAVDGSGNVHVTGGFRGTNVDFDPSAGTANLSSAGNNDIFIAKYDASGNYMWANRVGSTSDDIGYGIAVDGSGNVHVTGYFQATNVDFDPGPNTENLSSAGSADIFIAKYDASGNYVWAKRVGNTSGDQGLGLALDGSGNVHVTGFFNTTNVDFDPGAGTATLASAGGNDIFIAKYDASGNYVEAMQAGSTGSDAGYCIAAGAAGKVAAGGRFDETVDFDPGVGTSDRTAVATSGDIFIAQYTFTATAPEINLKGNSLSIADGDVTPDVADHTDFENACVNSGTVVRTFTIENTGTADLTIPAAGITLSGANMADFTVGGITLPATITGGNATTFTVTFDPSAAGLRSATVNIANDDSDENPYDFAIQGTGVANPSCNITSGPTSVCPASAGHVYTAGGGTYQWSIDANGTGASLNAPTNMASVTVTAGTTGTFTITVTVTANGCTSSCSQTVTVEDVTPPSISCPANQSVPFDNTSPCSAIVSGIDATPNDNCGASLTYALSGATTGSGNGQASGLTFNAGVTTVTYTATDGAGLQSSCMFTVTVQACLEISGTILWSTDLSTPVEQATVNLSGSATGSDLTDVNGDFSFILLPQTGNFTLKPVKNINFSNGLFVNDALAIQQHLTGINVITDPYRIIACDVNGSNSVSTFDATLIKQLLLGNPLVFSQFKKSWRFVTQTWTPVLPPWGFPEQIDLTGVSTDQPGQDFYGIKIGDVIANFADPANFGGGSNSPAPLVLRAEDRLLEQGKPVVVTLTADAFDDLAAWQFALKFDPQHLHFDSVEVVQGGVLPLATSDFGLFGLAAGEIRAVWTGTTTAVALPGGTEVFRLHFRALESGHAAQRSAAARRRDFTGSSIQQRTGTSGNGVELQSVHQHPQSGRKPIPAAAKPAQSLHG